MPDLTEDFELSPEFSKKYCQGNAWPLPRLARHESVQDKYDVVIAGAGPSGLLLKLLLARYGLGDEFVLCVDHKGGPVDVGNADGLNARTIEMLATLGLEDEVIRDGRALKSQCEYKMSSQGIKKVVQRELVFCPARFTQISTLHQGRLERLLLRDLQKYSSAGVEYSSSVVGVVLDKTGSEYPAEVTIRTSNGTRTVRAKYVVGADGAHSVVRQSVNIEMEGDVTDEIWGVIDFVPETNFDDIRRAVHINYENGVMAAMTIPREKMSDGNWLMRIYLEMAAKTVEDKMLIDNERRGEVRRKKAEITKNHILDRIQDLFAPYQIGVKPGTHPVWWTTYAVGQRLAQTFLVEDSNNHPRVFLIGDACHTHSPRQGQGMNISTQDAYYLSWRLAYSLLDLTPDKSQLLRTYEDERRPWAERVVLCDKRWNQSGLAVNDILDEMRGQVTGCGLEEKPGFLVSERNDAVQWHDKDLLNGVLRTGRRLFNVRVKRWADGTLMDIHYDFPSNGRYRILMLASLDFPNGRSRLAVDKVCALTESYWPGLVEVVVIQPHAIEADFGWADIPAALKKQAEMRVHCGDAEVYATYAVSKDDGAIALVRPDGIVCITVGLEGVDLIQEMLQRVLVSTEDKLERNGDRCL